MKTSSGILLSVITLLLAVMPALAADTNVERDYEIALTKGQYEIELGNYAAAAGYLEKALQLKPGDQEARISLGIAYSRAGDDGRAREVLQKAVKSDPANSRAQYELALVLGKLGQGDESKRIMTAVAKSADPELSEAAAGFLGRAGDGARKKFTPKLSGGLQYDSNVILEQDSPIIPGVKNSDWRWVWMVNADYSLLDAGKAGAEVGYQFYKSIHHELKDYNVEQHMGRLAGRYAISKTVSADLEYDLIYTSLRGGHYSTTHRFAFRLPMNLAPGSVTDLHGAYENKRFFDNPAFTGLPDKNGTNTAAGVSHTIMVGKKAAIFFDYSYDADSAEVESWSYAGHKGTVNALAEWGDYRLFGTLSYYDRKYDAPAAGAPEKRHDGAQEYSVGVSRKAGKTVTVTLSDLHTINDSNLRVYQYTRNVISLIAEIRL